MMVVYGRAKITRYVLHTSVSPLLLVDIEIDQYIQRELDMRMRVSKHRSSASTGIVSGHEGGLRERYPGSETNQEQYACANLRRWIVR